ncbi:hypothetical protein EVA_03243 [gut metagenome]|uniref:Uncharacterized protein n=1 Tax=gut metagenome TaxID=749906 RepID=J9GZF4_9ZZZZ
MHIGHQKIMTADACHAVILDGADRERAVFTNHILVTDHQFGIFSGVLFILRFTPDTGTREKSHCRRRSSSGHLPRRGS